MKADYKAKAAMRTPTMPAVEAPIWTMLAAPVEEEDAAEPEAVEDEEPEEVAPESEEPESVVAAGEAPVPEAEAPVSWAPEDPVALALKKRELMQDCWHLP